MYIYLPEAKDFDLYLILMGMSIEELAIKCKVKLKVIQAVLDGKDISIKDARKINDALNLGNITFFTN